MNQNILFTCAGRRNYLINYFKEAIDGKGKIIAADQTLTAPAMVDADIAIEVPNIYDSEYINSLIEAVKEHQITAIISLNDLELPILSKNKKILSEYGVKVLVSDENVIDIAFDKWKTFQFIEKIGLNTPKTYITLESALEAVSKEELSFPVVLKPRWGSASIGIDFPENIEELKLAYALQKIKLQRSILSNASSEDVDKSIMIQEKINGKELGMDILNDFNGNYVGTYAKEKVKMRSGETDKALSVIDNELEEIGSKIGEKLSHIGNLDCDVFKLKNKNYVLELNPRFGGGYPFSHESGVNIAAIYIDWLNGINDIDRHNNYKEGYMFSKCDRLIRVNELKK